MKKHTSYIIVLLLALWVSLTPTQTRAWFGAGQTPGIPPTSSGLSAEIELPVYKFSPDFYGIGDTVSLHSKLINPNESTIDTPVFLRIYHVSEAPTGTDVSDGEPSIPGQNENDLFAHFTGNTLVKTLSSTSNLGTISVPASGTTVTGSSFVPSTAGYYQFVFTTVDADVSINSGNLITTGFFRVLARNATPTPNPTLAPTPTPAPSSTPSPTPSPSSTPVPTSTPTPSVGKQSALSLSTPTCSNRNTTVTLKLTKDGFLQSGIKVKFTYAGEAKEATTDLLGEVSAVYGYKDGSDVKAEPEQGYPSQLGKITDATGCPASSTGSVLGATTDTENTDGTKKKRGQVLGASTFADTGMTTESILTFAIFAGLILMGFGLFAYGTDLILE